MLSGRPKESQGNSLATVLTATIFTIFSSLTKDASFVVGRASSFVVGPKVATFVQAVSIVNIVAVKTVAREFPWESLGRADNKFS